MAWARRPSNRTGVLLVAGGLTWLVASLVNTLVPVLIAAGQIAAWVPVALVLHVLLTFPSGRLGGTGARALAVAGYLTAVLPQPVRYAATPNPPPYDVLFVADRPDVASIATGAQSAAVALPVGVVAAVLVRHREGGRRALVGHLRRPRARRHRRGPPPRPRRRPVPDALTGLHP